MNYDSDEDTRLWTPGLVEVKLRATPQPTPPPQVTRFQPRAPEDDEIGEAEERRRERRRQRRREEGRSSPCQADAVVIDSMNPNYRDVARRAAQEALNSGSEDDDTDDELESSNLVSRRQLHSPSNHDDRNTRQRELSQVAQTALGAIAPERMDTSSPATQETRRASESQAQTSPVSTAPTGRPRNQSIMGSLAEGISSMHTGGGRRYSKPVEPDLASPASPRNRIDSVASTDRAGGDAMSPRLRSLSIPHDKIDRDSTLPAFRRPAIPDNLDIGRINNGEQTSLPGFQQLSELADAASRTNESDASSSYMTSRTSFSSSAGAGQSPTLLARHYSIGSVGGARSPTAFPPLSQTSPISTASELSPRENFLFSANFGNVQNPYHRRQSQASEGAPPYASLASPSSSETLSPSSHHASPHDYHHPHRINMDGNVVMLPPPQPSASGMHSTTLTLPLPGLSGFKCDHPGCTAPPFQTQYLLNSHANVHSSNRPHYCPVPNCVRGEGGKGFKRKNEMIRHGLVHDSPGYVCPFCPDREHKYPRPDNLQRHVRVHHPEKDKDDAQLRDVLALRPEGGGRGRRRRVGERLEFR